MPPRTRSELAKLSLGKSTFYDLNKYNPELLQSITNQNPNKIAWHSFICHEFTSLCPKTGQPDFAKIYINYIPHRLLVESKSLKLYLFSFRNHGDFHEDCVQKICDDLEKLILPRYLEVIGEFTPRGGIAIYPFCQAFGREKPWRDLARHRLLNYRPGLFSLPSAR